MDDVSPAVFAFTADQVARLKGLSMDRLREWDSAGFFQPRYAHSDRRTPYSRIYSFRDVVGLRVLKILRTDYKVSLRHLKDVAQELSQHSREPWSELRLYVLNREVHFNEPDTGTPRGVLGGQYALLPLEDVEEDMRARVAAMRRRADEAVGRIQQRRNVVRNAPVIAGTRIPVSAIQRFAKAGYSTEDIQKEYPSLTRKDIEAAKAYKLKRAI